jgi:hypothetical protein
MPAPTALRIVQLWCRANTWSYALDAGPFNVFPLLNKESKHNYQTKWIVTTNSTTHTGPRPI